MVHRIFLDVVLLGSATRIHQANHPASHCFLDRLAAPLFELISDFLGVERGRRLRNARELAEAIEGVGLHWTWYDTTLDGKYGSWDFIDENGVGHIKANSPNGEAGWRKVYAVGTIAITAISSE